MCEKVGNAIDQMSGHRETRTQTVKKITTIRLASNRMGYRGMNQYRLNKVSVSAKIIAIVCYWPETNEKSTNTSIDKYNHLTCNLSSLIEKLYTIAQIE